MPSEVQTKLIKKFKLHFQRIYLEVVADINRFTGIGQSNFTPDPNVSVLKPSVYRRRESFAINCLCLFNYCFLSLSPSLPLIFFHSFIFSFHSSLVCYSVRCLAFLSFLICQIFIYFLLQCPLFRLLNVVYFLFLTFFFCFVLVYSSFLRSSFRSSFSLFVSYLFRSFLFLPVRIPFFRLVSLLF